MTAHDFVVASRLSPLSRPHHDDLCRDGVATMSVEKESMRDGVARCGTPVVMGLCQCHDTVMVILDGRDTVMMCRDHVMADHDAVMTNSIIWSRCCQDTVVLVS